jgi:methyltransferase (TIGR00027 family)
MAATAAKTGLGPTAMVAVEQNFAESQRIIVDDLAWRMLPLGGRSLVWLMRFAALRNWMVRATEKSLPGIWAGMMCRKRYIDEKLARAADRIDAVVNLGAGFDTRVYRLPLGPSQVWEADLPTNIRAKQTRVREVFGAIPAHIKLVPIDLDREDLAAALASHGYSAEKRTFFVWEAVSQYLTEAGIRGTFDFLAEVASGSLLCFTYVRKDFLEGRAMYGWEAAYKKFVMKERLWLFGMEPYAVPAFLDPYGWRVIEDVGYAELAERYVKLTGRNLASTAVERMVYAEKL